MRNLRRQFSAGFFTASVAQRQRRARTRRKTRLTRLESLEARQVLAGVPVISELLASNGRIIEDQDGDDSDFIELYNAGDDAMSLGRYYLTDNPNDLQKWRLPDVSLAAGEYLVVYASGKDRNDPSDELHTNFRLSTEGEFLALVEPDGQTIVSGFTPGYPAQATDVSYGLPTGMSTSTLIDRGAAGRLVIPTDGSLDPSEPDAIEGTWLQADFDDSGGGWVDVATGVGSVVPDTPVVLADSQADFSGVQGQDNWRYGSWIKNLDLDGEYAVSDFTEANATRFFDAAANAWVFAPRSTSLTPQGGHPGSAANAGLSEAAIRRWTSETEGEITISGTLANDDATGDGVIGRILVNGEEVYAQSVNGSSTTYSVTATVAIGDVVDFVIDAGAADDETGDATQFSASIVGMEIRTLPEVPRADSSDDWERTDEQGINNWYYGYYDRGADFDQTYQTSEMTVFSAAFWNGSSRWEFPTGSIDTQIRSTSMAPHADDGVVHWAIKRWVSDSAGSLSVEYDFSKAATGGDGVTARLFHNGIEVDNVQIAQDDRTGTTRRVTIPDVRQGDVIDFAVDPLGPGIAPEAIDGSSDRANVDIRIARIADISENFQTNIHDQLVGVGTSAYLRVPFNVSDLSALDQLTLKMKYGDGFVAYVNGQRVAAGNAPDDTNYASVAVEPRSVEDITAFELFDLTEHRGLFVQGQNVLQIHLLNDSLEDHDTLALPILEVGTLTADLTQARYFNLPTPGAENGLGADSVGPLVVETTHAPNTPAVTEPLVISATIAETFSPVADVSLTYRVMYEDSTTVTMLDDGQGSDEVAGDGIYTATIPAGVAEPGQMIRWYVTARDTNGLNGRGPAFANPATDQEYFGTIVADPSVQSNLPIYHWFVESPNRANSANGTSGSIFYDGEFYDNVNFSLHGQSSSGFPTQKKSLNIDFPNDHRLRIPESPRRLEDINWLTNFADKSKMRNTLGYEQRAMTGGAYHLAYPIRVQQNGEFYAVYDFVEDADERWLERLGYNADGSLYKIYNTFNSPAGAEKKAGPEELGNEDLQEVIAGIRQRGDDSLNYIMDNVNIAQMVNYVAGFAITSNRDCCHKNFYAYHDSEGTGEWWFLPWDVDLSQGRNWGGFGLAYFDDTMYPNNELRVGTNNELISRLFNTVPGFADMFNRRLRSLMDQYIQRPGTPADQLRFENRIDELYNLLKPDADLDNEKHPATWGQTGFQTFDQAVQILLDEYVKPRRDFLYLEQVVADDSDVRVILSGEPGAVTGKYFVPTDESLGRTWTQPEFDDSSWQSAPLGLGFESGGDNYTDLIATDLGNQLEGRTSLYARIPFTVDDPSALTAFSLRMKYEDGYVAYINGVEVNREGLREDEPTFDSTSRSRSSRSATEFENINLSDQIGLLKPGENVLAIHSINSSSTSNDMFFLPELVEGVISNSRGVLPLAQRGNPKIDFGTIEFNPNSGNQQEEYIQLVNNTDVAVDISGWHLAGDVEWTFDPGTVIAPGFTLYATPNAKAFRARAEAPTGGMQLWVQGNYEGTLPNSGGTVQLVAADGQVVNETTYEGTVSPLQESLRISEVMYNPLPASAAELAVDNSLISEDFEFIEFLNVSATDTLDLNGVHFTNGIQFDFTGSSITQLAPGERVVVVANQIGFQTRYGQDQLGRIAGTFAANTALRDTGEQIRVVTADGSVIVDFAYTDNAYQGWPERADGLGSSLQIVDASGDFAEPTNWRASSEIGGSPGAAGAAAVSPVVINELLSRSVPPQTDQIELYNPSNEAVSLANYYLSDSATTVDSLKKYALGDVTIPAGGYLVLTEEQFNAGGDENPNAFALSGDGEQLFLTMGDANGPTHFVDAVSFGAAVPGESFARTPNGTGPLAPASSQTLGAANSAPRVGPVVITEVMAAAGEPSAAALAIDPDLSADNLEFVEIFNSTASAVDLTNWRLRLGIDYNFEDQTQLASGQTLLVVPFSTDNAVRMRAFRAHYGIDESVAIVGGYGGQLSAQGDGVQLQRAGTPAENDPEAIPRLLEDEVIYDNLAPWPIEATAGGLSLSRTMANAYGNDAASWVAAEPTPGAYGGDIPGDLTNDGRLDGQDAAALHAAAMAGDPSADLDGNGVVDVDDMIYLVEGLMGTAIGDVDFNGTFDSNDLIRLFVDGQFEDGIAGNSSYASGDWNLDGEFDSEDLLLALERNGYADVTDALAALAANHIAAAVTNHEVSGHQERVIDKGDVQDPTDDPLVRRPLVDMASRDQIFAEFDADFLASSDDSDSNTELDRLSDAWGRPLV